MQGRYDSCRDAICEKIFSILADYFSSSDIYIEEYCKDGDFIENGKVVASLTGNAMFLLAGERIALNILQRLSGIATLTKQFIEK